MKHLETVLLGWKADRNDIAAYLGCKTFQVVENTPLKQWSGKYKGTSFYSESQGMILVQEAKPKTVFHFVSSLLELHSKRETPISRFGVPILTLKGGHITKGFGLEAFKPQDSVLIHLLKNRTVRDLIQYQAHPKTLCYAAYHPKYTVKDLALIKIANSTNIFPEYDFIQKAFRITSCSERWAKRITKTIEKDFPCKLMRTTVENNHRWDILFTLN